MHEKQAATDAARADSARADQQVTQLLKRIAEAESDRDQARRECEWAQHAQTRAENALNKRRTAAVRPPLAGLCIPSKISACW